MKKLLISALMMSSVIPTLSFAAISEQDKVNFKNIYSEIKPETSTKILNFCDKNDTNIASCLMKLKAQPSEQKLAKNKIGYNKLCCLNVSGQVGEYAYFQGQNYCIWPC